MKFLPFLILFLSLTVSAQIEATTKDGKTVILKPNGTWEYSKTTKPVAGKTDLSVEAAIIYRSGEVVPVARTALYLLDKDVLTILKETNVQPTETSLRVYKDTDEALTSSLARAFAGKYMSLPDYQRFREAVSKALEGHIVAQITTDFTGKGAFKGVEKKSYFLFAVGATRQSGAVWNLAIDASKESSVILDQNNTIFAY